MNDISISMGNISSSFCFYSFRGGCGYIIMVLEAAAVKYTHVSGPAMKKWAVPGGAANIMVTLG